MSVSIGTITAVLIVGHIVVFLLLLLDARQGVVTEYDRAFLWGKALQIAGWGLMMAAASTGLVVLFCAGNATLVCGWSLEILAMLSEAPRAAMRMSTLADFVVQSRSR